jgi:hypothetical protein
MPLIEAAGTSVDRIRIPRQREELDPPERSWLSTSVSDPS